MVIEVDQNIKETIMDELQEQRILHIRTIVG